MLFALLLTICIEAFILYFLLGGKDRLAEIALINLFTNPLANMAYMGGLKLIEYYVVMNIPKLLIMLVIEAIIIAVEAGLMKMANFAKPWQTSLQLNIISFALGLLIL